MSEGLADVAERLMAEFEGILSPDVVSAAVCRAGRDLADAPPGAFEELVERRARQRLVERL